MHKVGSSATTPDVEKSNKRLLNFMLFKENELPP